MTLDILNFAILGAVGLLSLLSALDVVANRKHIPLPILAAIAGLMLGALAMLADPQRQGLFLDSYDMWFVDQLALTPQSVVVIFLPPLLFEVTLGVDVRKLRQDAAVVSVMAVLAVVVATIFVGVALSAAGQLPLLACLLLGATIATTDPAAVVAIFRRIGAPRRLLIVLEGESLLNDAAAIALFVLMLEMLRSNVAVSAGQILVDFTYLFAMGALTGYAAGHLAARLFALMRHHFLAQATLMLAMVYATYLLAEIQLGASGVVAVVVAGLTITVGGASRVTSEDWNAVRLIWSQLGYWANGLIILIASALSPALLATLELGDLWLVAIVAIVMLVARGCVLFGVLPALDAIGLSSSMSTKQKLLVWWGGIRGAVTLLLALSLASSSALPDGLGEKLAAVGMSFVFVTLFVNGGTLSLVTRALGLDRLSPSDAALRHEMVERTIRSGLEHVDELAEEHDLPSAAVAPVRAELEQRLAHFEADAEAVRTVFGDRLRTGLIMLANQERRVARQHHDGGIISRDTMQALQRTAERLADAAIVAGRDGYAEEAKRSVDHPAEFRLAVWLQRHLRIDTVLSSLLARRFRLLFEWELVLKELARFAEWNMGNLLGEEIADNLRELLEERRETVRDALVNLELQYPVYAQSLRQGFVARAALRWEAGRYDRFLREAIIGADLHRDLMREVNQRLAATYAAPPPDLGFDRSDLFDRMPIFADLDRKTRRRLRRAIKVRSVLPGEVVAAKGERGDAMYFIASGSLEMTEGGRIDRLGTGDFFGEVALLRPTRRRRSEVVATGFCRLLVLRRDDFRRLTRKFPELRATIEAAVLARQDSDRNG